MCPPYIALSYAWDAGGPTSPVEVNGRMCQISETIEQALRRLRHGRNKVYIWIDQICINENDATEKTHQVQQMWRIYSKAERVVAWLGPFFPNSDKLFKHLQRMGRAALTRDWKTFLCLHRNRADLVVIKEGFRLFCQSHYWTRLSIMQEFSVANRLSIACGECPIDWKTIEAALTTQELLEERMQIRQTKIKALHQKVVSIFYPPERSFLDNVITRRQSYGLLFHCEGNERDYFFRVLVTSLVLEMDYNCPAATDHRDRVFALLHLAIDSGEFRMFPDYNKSCEEVYIETALKFLKQGHVDILAYCQFPKKLKALPSWVPDWNMEVRNPCAQAPWFSRFSASGRTQPTRSDSQASFGHLVLQGVPVDVVRE
ncbi:hypothetical protein DL768_001910 [Monosporascus sp. mg162]|nr:hypothetical protein DL768_001910 [Monosporascus sp. mg162]